jgi:hypothetical protein
MRAEYLSPSPAELYLGPTHHDFIHERRGGRSQRQHCTAFQERSPDHAIRI